MNLIELFDYCPDIRNYVNNLLTDEDKCICNLVCKELQSGNYIINLPNYAASIGSINLLNYTIDHDYIWNDNICNYAVKHLDTLKWLVFNGMKYDKTTFASAAGCGQKETIIWMYKKWEENKLQVFEEKEKKENIRVCSPLNQSPWTSDSYVAAACNDDLDLLTWFRDNGTSYKWEVSGLIYNPNEISFIEAVIKYNKMDILKWLFNPDENEGIYPNVNHISIAIKYGHIHIIEYLLSFDGKEMFQNHLIPAFYKCFNHEMNENLLINIKLDTSHVYYSILYNQMDVYKWLLNNGCKNSNHDISACIKSGNTELLESLLNRNYILDDLDPSFYSHSDIDQQLFIKSYKILHKYGHQFHLEPINAMLYNHIDILNWFLEENIPITFDVMTLLPITKMSELPTIKWIIDHVDPNQIEGLNDLMNSIPLTGSVDLHEFMIVVICILTNIGGRDDISNTIKKDYKISINMRIMIPILELGLNAIIKYLRWKSERELRELELFM